MLVPATARTLALNEGCETTIYVLKILEVLKIEKIPICAITDNKLLHEVSNFLTVVENRLLRVKIALTSQMIEIENTI